MKKKFVLGSILLLVVTGVVLGFTLFRADKNNGIHYKTETIEKGHVESVVVTTGALNPVMQVDVGSQVSGIIKDIYVDFNSLVEKGQTTLDNLKKKNDRYAELFTKELVSFEDMESIETQYFNAKADLKSTEAKLSQAQSLFEASQVDLTYTVIRSPVDGVVIDRRVNVGQTVAASMQAPVLFLIAQDLSQMQVECSIDEADIGLVAEGQDVRFSVDAYPEKNFVGTISQVRYSPEITQNVVTYTTIVDVDNPDLNLLPGMTATVSIIVEQAENVMLIPNAALRYSPQFSEKNPQRIWVLDENNNLKPVPIITGVTDNSLSELVEGDIKEGQLIITGEESSNVKTENSNSSRSMNQVMRMIR